MKATIKKPMRPINLETLTLNGWIEKACKVSPFYAPDFLAMTMPFLTQASLIGVTDPTLGKFRAKLLYATPAIHELIPLLVNHAAITSLAQAKERSERQEKQSIWTVVIFDGEATPIYPEGKEVLREGFELAKDAEGWCQRRLVEQCSTAYGIISSTQEKTVMRVERDDAMYFQFGVKRGGTVMKTNHVRMRGLGLGMKCARDSRASFSHG